MYTKGNPVNLTDPSGHDPWWCEGRANEQECINSWVISQTENKPGLTKGSLFNTPIGEPATQISQVKTYGGRQLWRVFLEMLCENDAWWHADPSNKFSYEMFIGLMIFQEANMQFTPGDEFNVTLTSDSLKRADLITKVVATVMKYGGFKEYSCGNTGGNCQASIFNFWADHSQVSRNLINDYYELFWNEEKKRSVPDYALDKYAGSGPASIGQYYNRKSGNRTPPQLIKVLSEASRLGNNALHDPLFATQNGPIMYGLNSNWTRQLSLRGVRPYYENGPEIYYYTPEGVIFYTESQYGYWRGVLGSTVDQMDAMPNR